MSGPRLLVVRHGRTSWNATHRFQGQTDIPLDEVGEAQAAALAGALTAVSVAAVISSDLGRAVATAAPLAAAAGVTPTADPRLREIYLGAWQGLDADAAATAFPAEYDEWRAGHDVRRGAGENYADVAERATSWVESACAAHPSGLLVAVTHGGTARALTGSLIGLPVASWSALGPLGNCRIAVLGRASETRWRLLAWNAGPVDDLGLPGLGPSHEIESVFR